MYCAENAYCGWVGVKSGEGRLLITMDLLRRREGVEKLAVERRGFVGERGWGGEDCGGVERLEAREEGKGVRS
jgi:hypothetical protein